MARVEIVGGDQFFGWRLHGGSTWLSAGDITGGSAHKINNGVIEVMSIGGVKRRKLGKYSYEGSVDGTVLPETLTMLAGVVDSAGVLPEIMLGIGLGHGTYCHDPAVLKSFSLKQSDGGQVEFTMDWVAEAETSTVPTAVTAPTSWLFADYEVDVSFAGEALNVSSWSISCDYGTTQASGGIKKGTTGVRRAKTGGLLYSPIPNVEVDIELYVAPDLADYLGDCPDSGSLLVEIEDACGVSPYEASIQVDNLVWQVDDEASFNGDSAAVVPWKGKLIQLIGATPTITLPA